MSNINPQNIDGSYPIAGQDNNSQGFRDNFTNTINNFTFAAAELTDLQTYAVLTAPLSSVGQTSTPVNNMNYTYLTKPQLKGAVETKNDLGSVSSSSFSVDWSVAHFQTVSITTQGTLSFASTWPTTNLWTKLRLQVTTTNLATLILPDTISWVNLTNIAGYTTGTTLVLPAGVYVFEFSTYNNGSTVTIEDVLRGPITRTIQQFSPTANVAITANVGVERLLITPTPSGGITSFFADVTLPNTRSNGTTISISSNVAVGTFRALPSWNSTVSPDSNVSISAGSSVEYTYVSADNKWYKTR